MKKFLFIKCLILFLIPNVFFLGAQEENGIPPSPTVASLATIEKDSVNNTGKVVHKLPLWDIELGGYSFPINLIYSSSGIKVEETPTYVGTGWNLLSGGVITRSVVDHPDDLLNDLQGSGILHTNLMAEIESFNNSVTSQGYNETNSANFFRYNVNEENLDTRNDTQPDVFYFSLFNYSGKFIFNKDKEIVSLSNENFKFSYTLDGSDSSLKTFTIIDTNGIEYFFSEREYSQTYYNSNGQWEFLSSRAKRQRQLDFYSAWHLTSITTPKGHIINFEYDDEIISYNIRDSEMGKICFTQQCEDANINDTSGYDIQNNSQEAITDFTIESKKVSRISSDQFSINFTNTSRDDLNGGLKLDLISINDHNDNSVCSYNFEYSYFVSPNMPASENYEFKRLRLDQILKNNKVIESFEYYTDFPLPHRKSTEQDFWGYYNNNNSTSLVPKIYTTFNGQTPKYHIIQPLNETVTYTYGSVNRNVNPSTIHMGMLKKINSQTGGYKEFFYEPNDFTLIGYTDTNDIIEGNGVRLSRVEYNSGNNVEEINYNYNHPLTGLSSGRVSYLPQFATHIPWNFVYSTVDGFRVSNPSIIGYGVSFTSLPIYETDQNGVQYLVGYEDCVINTGGVVNNDFSPYNNPGSYFSMTTRRFSSTQLPLSTNITNQLVYEFVTTREGSNGTKVFNFDILGAIDYNIPLSFDNEKFNKKPVYKTNFWVSDLDSYLLGPPPQVCPNPPAPIGTYMLNKFNQYYQYVDISGDSHPFAPKPNWNRFFGNLKNYTFYNEQGYKVLENEYHYETLGNYINEDNDKKVVSLKYRLFNRPIGFGGWSHSSGQITPSTGPTAWIWSFYDTYYHIGLAPKTITQTKYFNNEESYVSTVSENEYTFGNILRSTTSENSKGDIIETYYKYTPDFQNSNNLYYEMVNNNLLYKEIEVVKKVNEIIISASVNEYGLENSIFCLKNSYQLETLNTMYNYTYAQPVSDELNGDMNLDPKMTKKVEYNLYDSLGNLIQYRSADGIYHSIIWGYSNSLPICQIDGATYDEANLIFQSLNGLGLNFDDIILLSDNDTDLDSESEFREKLILIRDTLSSNNISVKSATYDPLIGLTSVIDSRGDILFFEYDNFHRLINIKDDDGNILNEYEYNYKNQN